MKRVNPSLSTNTLYVITRDYTVTTPVSVTIRQDGAYVSETISVTPSYTENYCQLDCNFTILEEDSVYFMEVKNGSDLLYRDRLYATSSTDYIHGLNAGEFTIDTEGEDEEYIILED
jgi:hypothetical protein